MKHFPLSEHRHSKVKAGSLGGQHVTDQEHSLLCRRGGLHQVVLGAVPFLVNSQEVGILKNASLSP